MCTAHPPVASERAGEDAGLTAPPDRSRRSSMSAATTALLLVGYQNDLFAHDGGLRDLVDDVTAFDDVMRATTAMLRDLPATAPLVIAMPLSFTPDYAELVDPVGVLAAIRDRGLLQEGTDGAATVDALSMFGDRITVATGRRGLDAFANTTLDEQLRASQVRDVVVAGAITSLCIDATARSAAALGYRVTVLADCTAPATSIEQSLFCEQVFPMYGDVIDAATFLALMAPRGPFE